MDGIYIGNIRGPKGDTGNGLTIFNYFDTIDELPSNPSAGDAYGIKNEDGKYDIYIYSPNKGWVNNGALQPDINEQAPNYDESTTLESLISSEKISLAFGKIKKAINELISHLADSVKHITSEERTKWDNKAPGGHGLGNYCSTSTGDMSFKESMAKGCGFYTLATSDDSPTNTKIWLSLLQIARANEVNNETGAQLAFNDWDINNPKMWMRTLYKSDTSKWVEMLHTGNLTNNKVARMETQSYTGNGLYGFENARTFTFSFQPKMFYISGYGRAGGNYTLTVPFGFPFAHIVVHTDNGFATMNCEFRYSGNSITVFNTTSATNGFNTDGKDYTITAIG